MAKKKATAVEPQEKSRKYELIKGYYDDGLWKLGRVRDVVSHGWITAAEFKEITGIDYDAGESI